MTPLVIILIVILVISAVLIPASFYFYNVGVLRRPKEFMNNNPDLQSISGDIEWDADASWMEEQHFEDISIKSYDGLNLHASYLKADVPANQTVVLAHGYAAKGKEMGAFAEFYHDKLGFNVLIPDNRGHGESEGNYIGFGWHDRKDYIKWIDYIIEKNGKDSQIVMHGISMGGSTVLMVSGEELPQNLKCIVSDSAYTSAKDILAYHMKKMYKVPPFPLIYLTSIVCKMKAGYYFGEASALKQVGKAKVPILFIHGGDDKFIPSEMVFLLYEKCSSEKKMYVVQKAAHGLAYFTDKGAYEQKVSDFIKKYLS